MKTKKKIILAIVGVVVIAGSYIGYRMNDVLKTKHLTVDQYVEQM
jgi:hypothetical protein